MCINTQISWRYTFFEALSPYDLYAIIQLRNQVFVVEQNCVFQDADNKDLQCYHLMGFEGNVLAAYARLVPAGVSYADISIGRVVTSVEFRRRGVGKILMRHAIDACNVLFGDRPIKIGAQVYLKHFYETFGFKQSSQTYMEDGIPHIEMLKP